MTKCDELVLLADAWQRHSDQDVEELVDAILDALMNPGDGALEAGEAGIDEYYHGAKDAPFKGSILACHRAILTHVKEGKS